jgi:hypothetical protein
MTKRRRQNIDLISPCLALRSDALTAALVDHRLVFGSAGVVTASVRMKCCTSSR